jgi:hypothetical protein
MENQMYRSGSSSIAKKVTKYGGQKLEPYTTCRKYKEVARVPLEVQPINQPRQIFLPVWTATIATEVRKML